MPITIFRKIKRLELDYIYIRESFQEIRRTLGQNTSSKFSPHTRYIKDGTEFGIQFKENKTREALTGMIMNSLISKGNLKTFDNQIYQTWGMLPEINLYNNDKSRSEELVEKIQMAHNKGQIRNRIDKSRSNISYTFRDFREKHNQETDMVSTQYGGQMDSDKIRNRSSSMLSEDVIEPAQKYIKKAREYGSNALDRGTELVRENPGYTILGAAAVGFLCGAYFARRR